MTETQRVWSRQIASATRALLPWKRTTPDGFDYVDPSAPRQLVAAYTSLLSAGYANGWMP